MTDLIFLHGFLSSPRSRKIGHFLQHLPDSHIAPLINNYRVVDLYPTQSDFESMTITKLVDRIGKDLSLNNTPSILIGSSHGGLIALAGQQAYSEMVKGMVLLSPAIRYYDILRSRYDLAAWRDRGYIEVAYNRFDGETRLKFDYMEDLQKYGNWSAPDIPILLIHGKQDDVVPLEHSRSFAREGSRITEFYPATGVHHLGNVISQITPVLINWLASILSV